MKIKRVDFYRLARPLDLESPHDRDYLRYDRGFVWTGAGAVDGTLVAFPTLIASLANGAYLSGPTFDRWPRDFGLKPGGHLISDVEVRIVWEQTERWMTYRHPRTGGPAGAEDYSKLFPITLREVLLAKDLTALPLYACTDCGENMKPVKDYAGTCMRTWHHLPEGTW